MTFAEILVAYQKAMIERSSIVPSFEGLDVQSVNVLRNEGFRNKEEIREALGLGFDLSKVVGVGSKTRLAILEWAVRNDQPK